MIRGVLVVAEVLATWLLLIGGSVFVGFLAARWWLPLLPFLLGSFLSRLAYKGYEGGDTLAFVPFVFGAISAGGVLVGVIVAKLGPAAADRMPSHTVGATDVGPGDVSKVDFWARYYCPLFAWVCILSSFGKIFWGERSAQNWPDHALLRAFVFSIVVPAFLAAIGKGIVGHGVRDAAQASLVAVMTTVLLWIPYYLIGLFVLQRIS